MEPYERTTSSSIDSVTSSEHSGGTNLWRLLEVIALRKRFIFTLVGIATIGAVIISLLLPKWYRAESLLLPPKDDRMTFSSLSGALNDWASVTAGLNLPVMVTASDVYVRMLSSRAAKIGVIDSLQLREHFGGLSMSDALLAIDEYSDFLVTPEGLILVRYADQDAEMAAIIVNTFVDELDRIARQIYYSRTKQSLSFVETSLQGTQDELMSARGALRQFQEDNRAIDLNKQTELAINSASALKAELATLEVDLTLRKRSLSETHPEVVELAGKVAEYRNKISELEYGSGDSSYFSLPIAETPRLRSELADLVSRVQVAEQLYANLRLRYNEINIQSKRNAPTISVLDRAVTPEIRYKPQRSLIVAGTFGLSLIIAILFALFFEYLRRLEHENPEDFRRARFFFDTILKMK
ncbi:hypothetical protein JYT16_00485 [Gemmatimonas aurantiaca]|nr:hypothetical protein [Gemmatimonas aurantiaca]